MKPRKEGSESTIRNPDLLRRFVFEALKNRIRTFSICITDSGVVLDGSCDSFYAKQMVQEIVAHHSNLTILENNLMVVYPTPLKTLDD